MAEKKQKLPPFWVRIAKLEGKPKRKRMGVNLSKISKYSKAGQMVIVPDKVLSSGVLTHAVTIAASGFSATAKKLISAKGGKIISLEEAKKAHPTGKDCAIII